MTAVIVDWLGRGGIAHCTEAWAMELQQAGILTTVVTRPGREVYTAGSLVDVAPQRRNRIAAHRAVATHAARVIERTRPATVVVQNYVIPSLEGPVYRAARRVGAHLVVVVHDHRLHSRLAGSSFGLKRWLRDADAVVAHTHLVADACEALSGRVATVIPVPVPLGLLAAGDRTAPFAHAPGRLLAIHFGVLRRGYKGTDTVVELARSAPPNWDIAAVGVGAPVSPGLISVNRFVRPGELVASVESSDVTLLPYRFATQSGAVVLAQALKSAVVVASAGGIREQVEDHVTGLLLAIDAPVATWRSALVELSDGEVRGALADRAYTKVWEDHARFRAAAIEIVRATA